MSLIESGTTNTLKISYDDFESLPTGTYRATFQFPGLSYQVEKEEIQQQNGRIWLGALQLTSEVRIE
jgi:hypothetical protein